MVEDNGDERVTIHAFFDRNSTFHREPNEPEPAYTTLVYFSTVGFQLL